MTGYRIIIDNDPKDNLTWSLTFDSESSKYGNADAHTIFSVAHALVNALTTLQQQEKAQSEEPL